MRFASLAPAALAVAGLAAFTALAADPPPPATANAGPGFMASAPPADITVENVDGGARIVLKARDAKQVEAVRAFAEKLADHLKAGCPMMGAGPGAGRGMGRGAAAANGGHMCPNLATTP